MSVRPRTAPVGGSTVGYNLPPDLFVLVRPPPSASTHPLNLQIQLLVPSIARAGGGGGGSSGGDQHLGTTQASRRSGEYSRSSSRNGSIAEEGARVGSFSGATTTTTTTTGSVGGNSTVSFDAIAGASVSRAGSRSSDNHDDPVYGSPPSGELLSRTTSRGSTRSRGSTNSVSVRSDTTSASGAATRRRVTPLLNLNFHSVLPTVVTDAATDQRVAKFLKRGIEMSNLAIIDPIDLSQPLPLPSTSTPTGLSSSAQSSPSSSNSSASTPAASSTPTNNIFSKFKRFTLGASSPSPKPSPSSTTQQGMSNSSSASSFSLFSRSTSTSSNLSSGSTVHSNSPTKFLPSLVNSEGAPTPRTLPLLRSGSDDATTMANSLQSPVPSSFPATRNSSASASGSSNTGTNVSPAPVGYAFVVRKWLREDLAQISEPGGVPAINTAIRIEWVRASDQEYRKMGKRGRRRAGSLTGSGGSEQSHGVNAPSRRSSDFAEGGIPEVVPEHEELRSTSPTTAANQSHAELGEEEEDDGESSDPEDSERPFICTLFYPSSSSTSTSSTNQPSSGTSFSTSTNLPSSSSMQPSRSLRRLQLATLRPAPHHPKLISTLLLPPTLPSIPLGSFSPDQGLQGGVLSNEVLRDLVHTTSMWLSIREGLGGLGKEKDTQNIAAGLGLVKVRSGKMGRTLRGLKK